ncbi:MAG: DUF4199 domain-containing protein [Firmicutes bacterium]|nr:DUF4199 domain-containing protein [Bacillota bacterium]MCM1401458.1 DUF4199 domain-containing protein [Bacteroides sp.]MCM1476816.1 DUF4199 domain-containing protein [Bacteroides sp.]
MSPTDEALKSPFQRGVDCGWIFGIYFMAMFLAWVFSESFTVLFLLVPVLAIWFPFIVYRLQKSEYQIKNAEFLGMRPYGPFEVTDMWIYGIVMISCGTLISSVLIMVYLKWIDPEYVVRQLRRAIEVYNSTSDPSLAQAATMARALIDNQAVPTASTITLSLGLFTVASGSLVAGLMAVLVKLRSYSFGKKPKTIKK